MAVSAQILLSKPAAVPEQTVGVTVVITNTGASALNVNSVNPIATVYGNTSQAVALRLGVPQVGGAFPSNLPANGTISYAWGVTPHAPTTSLPVGEPGQITYSIGAEILTNDGSDTFATPGLLTVVSPNPAPLLQGQLNFTNPANSDLLL